MTSLFISQNIGETMASLASGSSAPDLGNQLVNDRTRKVYTIPAFNTSTDLGMFHKYNNSKVV